MDNIKEKDAVVLPDEQGDKVTGGVMPEMVYRTCKICGVTVPETTFDLTHEICSRCYISLYGFPKHAEIIE